MKQDTKTNLANADIWIRLLYMIIFGVMLAVARMVIWVVAILQFLLVLITGHDNVNLRNLGQGVARWSLQAFLFLTFNEEQKPFPFSDWPEIEEAEEPEVILATESAPEADDIPAFTDSASREKPIAGEVVPDEPVDTPEPDATKDNAGSDDNKGPKP